MTPYWQPSALSNPPVSYPGSGGYSPRAPNIKFDNSYAPNHVASPIDYFGVGGGEFGGPLPGVNQMAASWTNPTAAVTMQNPAAMQYFANQQKLKAANGPGGVLRNPAARAAMAEAQKSPWQQAYDQAKQANEARYQDILGGYQQRYQRGMDMLSGLGQQQARDINELYDQQAGQQSQDLIGRGLGNSTVMQTMQTGNNRERNADLARLNDQVRQQALQADSGLSADELQFMERRNDQYPDYGLMAQLAQGMGAAGYGAGGGSGGGGFGGGGGYLSPQQLGYQIPGQAYGYPMMPMYGGSNSQGGRSDAAMANAAARRSATESGRMANYAAAADAGGPFDWASYYARQPQVQGMNALGSRAVENYYSDPTGLARRLSKPSFISME